MERKEIFSFLEKANASCAIMGIEGICEMLRRCGNPEEAIPIIHIAGTNGKGSVGTYISTILAQAGYRVGRYVSPTIQAYEERIQQVYMQNGRLVEEWITPVDLGRIFDDLQSIYVEMGKDGCVLPSAFELETVACFQACLDWDCDVLVLEVGLGGKQDATNCIRKSLCSVFTSISMDHVGVLGNTLSEIAREKAGIIKEQGAVIAYDFSYAAKEQQQKDTITPVINEIAEEKNAYVQYADMQQLYHVKHGLEGVTFSYKDDKELQVSLLGEHQAKNATVAIETILYLQKQGWKITKKDIYHGLKKARWKGRFEILKQSPYVVVDGAHNLDAAKSLAKSLALYFKNKKIAFVVGILKDKDYQGIMEELAPAASWIYTLTPDSPRALDAGELAKVARQFCQSVQACTSMEEAIRHAEQVPAEVILIFGSLYSIHWVYDYFYKED